MQQWTKNVGRPVVLAFVASLVVALVGLIPVAKANHGNQRLEVTPEVESLIQGSTHSVTATLYQGSTNTAGGANSSTGPVVVDFTVESGPNQGEVYSCTIVTGNSNCSTSYEGDEGVGTDIISAVIRGHAADETEGRYAGPSDCPNPPNPNQPNGTSPGNESDCPEGQAQPGSTPETQADSTDVVEARWTQSVSGEVCIDAEPNSETNQSGSSHQIEVRVTNGMKITDGNGQFNCDGDPRADILLDLAMSDDDPNAFFETVNGQATGASGGGPNSVVCTTDGTGRCTATIRTVSPSAEGTNGVDVAVRGDTPGDTLQTDNEETVTKTWSRPGELTTIDASPEADTNEVGAAHVVDAVASDQFNNPVGGVLVSFQVTAGPHANNDLDADPNTPNGFFGRCTTDATGSCSDSYSGTEVGDDTITVFQDDDSDFTYDAPGPTGGGDQPSDQIAKTWVAQGQGTTSVRIDMETDPDNDNVNENGACDGDREAPIDESRWNDRANPNQVARTSAHRICAERFGPNNVPHTGPVVFRITSGPGHFTDESGQADLGRQVTASEDANGYNVAYLGSVETGDTVVEASSDNATDSGTKPWVAASTTARTITLEPETASNEPGSEHEVTATVHDKFGNPIEGVTVTFSETGAGRFVEGGSQTTRTTADNGTARARTTTGPNETGEQQITAAIDAGQTECDEAADRPEQGDPAGDCSDTVTKTWESQDGGGTPPECQQEGVICGTEGDDTIVGTEGDDIILAFGGNDTVDGLGGDDIIRLGPGNDVARGSAGEDLIRGGSGDDSLKGNDQRDTLRGGSGNDTLTGGKKNDILRGGGGRDILRGNNGWDNMRGGKGHDTLRGANGNDGMHGERGNDRLFGWRGRDRINGGQGRDLCRGGPGRDTTRNCER